MIIDQVLWAGTIGLRQPAETVIDVAAAVAAGAVSLGADAVARLDPIERNALRKRGEDRGVRVAVVDGLYTWMPLQGRLAERATALDTVLETAAEVGAEVVNALAVEDPMPTDARAERFAVACDRAKEHGLALSLEFAPLGGVADLAAAWEIIRRADRPNGGIVFDTWHFYRGTPDLELLAAIPGDRIFAVQISDADAEVRGTLWQDTIHHRRLPGEGVLDLHAPLEVLARTGGLRRAGPEVISDELHARGPEEAARLGVAAVARLLAELP